MSEIDTSWQEILARHVKKWSDRGEGVICEDCHVVGYEEREAVGKVAIVGEMVMGRRIDGGMMERTRRRKAIEGTVWLTMGARRQRAVRVLSEGALVVGGS